MMNKTLDKSWVLFWATILFLSAMTLWSLFVVPYLPTNDGPQHIFSAHVENHYDDPKSIYPIYVTLSPQFAYSGFSMIMIPMEKLFGWRLGSQLAIAFILLLNAWGFIAMVLALNQKRKWLSLLAFPFAWSFFIYMGFFAFAIGTGLGLWITACVLGIKQWNWLRWASLSGALFLQATFHVFTAVLTGTLVLCLFVFREQGWWNRIKRALKIGLLGIPASLIGLLTFLTWGITSGTPPFRERWMDHLFIFPRTVMPGPWSQTLAWLLLIVVAIGFGFYQLKKRAMSSDEVILFIFGTLSLLMAFFLPRDISNWQGFSMRFIPIAVSSLLILLPFEQLITTKAKILSGVLFFLIAFTFLKTFASMNQDLYAHCKDWIEFPVQPTHSNLRENPRILHIALTRTCGQTDNPPQMEIPHLSPEFHGAMLYAIQSDSLPASFFSGSMAGAAIKPREPPGITPERPYKKLGAQFIPSGIMKLLELKYKKREKFIGRAASRGLGAEYNHILITGLKNGDSEIFQQMGFVEDKRQGDVSLQHFEPCSVTLKSRSYSKPEAPELDFGTDLYAEGLIFLGAKGTLKGKKNGAAVYEYSYAPCGHVYALSPKATGALSIKDPKHRHLKNKIIWLYGVCQEPKEPPMCLIPKS